MPLKCQYNSTTIIIEQNSLYIYFHRCRRHEWLCFLETASTYWRTRNSVPIPPKIKCSNTCLWIIQKT